MAPCGSLTWLEFRLGVIMRTENELVSRNQIMQRALSHQKESELPSDRDGVPTEGLYQWGNVTLPFLEGETAPAAACRMDWRGARLKTRRKVRRLAAAVIQERDGWWPKLP